MRRILFVLLILSASLAGAQEERRFIFYMSGQAFGEERFLSIERGDTLTLTGKIKLGPPVNIAQLMRTAVRGPADDLLYYVSWTESGDSSYILAQGASMLLGRDDKLGEREKSWPLEGRKALALDTGLAQHIWLLARQIARDPEGAQPILSLIPTQLWAGPLERAGKSASRGKLDGKDIAVTTYALNLACVRNELDLGPDGGLLGMYVPAQDFSMRVPGYERAIPAGPEGLPEEEVNIFGTGPALPGSLILPAAGAGPHPACIILHDSGAMDRDLSFGPNRIYAQLAQGMAARGIASLRYDKRTYVLAKDSGSKTYSAEITLDEDVLDDAAAAFRLLAGDPRIDPARIFFLGHGLGAAAAPTLSLRLAEDGLAVAGLVMLAPQGRDLLKVYLEQYRFLNGLDCLDDDTMKRYEGWAERMYKGDLSEETTIFFASPNFWNSVIFWYPWEDYRKQAAPALVAFAGRDYQITAEDRETWARALSSEARPESRLLDYPSYNHFFLPGEGPPNPAELGRQGRLESKFLDEIAGWMKSRRP